MTYRIYHLSKVAVLAVVLMVGWLPTVTEAN